MTPSLRAVFINRYFYPDTSATARMLAELARDLSTAGVRVTVLAGDRPSDGSMIRHPKNEIWEGIRIRRITTGSFDRNQIAGWVANSLLFYPAAFFELLRLPRSDISVFLSDPPLVFCLGPLIRGLKGTPYACWSQDVYPEAAVGTGVLRNGGLPALILGILSRYGLRRAAGVIAIGEIMGGVLRDKGVSEDNLSVVHNWADGEKIHPVPQRENSFLRPLCLEDNFNVLYSGNMGLGNDFETILNAAETLKSNPRIRFIFIGDGKKRSELFNRAGNWPNVRFFPFQKEDHLSESLSGGTIHLVTLRPELRGVLVPSKLYGAMAAGRPVVFIGPEESEPAEMIRKGDFGQTIHPGDPEGLVRLILDLEQAPERVREMGEKARNVFEARFERRIATRAIHSALIRAAELPLPDSILKRMFDVFLSGLGLLGSSPLWFLFFLLIRLEDGGPVFYRQKRSGKGGRIFSALKFRSMVPNAEEKTGPVQAGYNDERITKIGRILRATAMDELPQLWNIFCGDMSFVGPRALRPEEIELRGRAAERGAADRFHLRHQVRPGLTGLAQIYAPRDARRSQKLRYDLLYIRSRTFLLDLRLILLSFWITFRGKWETRGKKV